MSRTRSRLITALCLVVALFGGIFVGKYIFEPSEINIPSHHFDEMSLLTWKGRSEDICFLLVPRIEQGRATHNFWSKWHGQCGVSQLKNALTAAPMNKNIVWINYPPRFVLPSEHFCDEMLVFAKSKGVKFRLNPMLDVEMFSEWEPRRSAGDSP
jgi:hypothetical protein